MIRPLNIALGEWISDVSAAADYSLYIASITEIVGCNIVGMSKYGYTEGLN